MSEFLIVTDSTSDLPQSIVDDHHLVVMPLKYHIDGKTYTNYSDNRELDPKAFYDLVRNGAQPTTSQINPDEYIETLTPLLEAGKDLLLLAFSSQLSGTFNSARLATNELKEKFPERKIYLLDTKSASLGEGMLVYLTAKQKALGKTIDECLAFAESLSPKVAHWFTVDDVGHLVRGGRLSKMAGFVAKIANIKPILSANAEGKLVARHKAIGRKRAIKALFDEMVKSALEGPQTVFIGHGDDIEAAQQLEKFVRETFEVDELVISTIGPVIGAHTGAGVLALFFVGNTR